MISIAVLGCTGSIGTQTLDVVAHSPGRFRVVGLASKGHWAQAISQAKMFGVRVLAFDDPVAAEKAEKAKAQMGLGWLKILSGPEGIKEVASLEDVEIVVHGIPGLSGLPPLLSALESGKRVAFAGKEALVSGGELLTPYLVRRGQGPGSLVPCDSEHSAIFQCLQGEAYEDIEEIILTASGGAFRDLSTGEMEKVTPEAALKHPTWKMGPKVTVDSATLFNKALEVMEAHYLFGIPYQRIKVVIHRQSIVHSMVAFKDGTIKAVLSRPDMRLAISYALTYPERGEGIVDKLDPYMGTLTFERPDLERFPCLGLGYRAGEMGGTAPLVISYADEILVGEFLRGSIRFTDIYRILERMLDEHRPIRVDSLGTLMKTSEIVKRRVEDLILIEKHRREQVN